MEKADVDFLKGLYSVFGISHINRYEPANGDFGDRNIVLYKLERNGSYKALCELKLKDVDFLDFLEDDEIYSINELLKGELC